MSGKNVKILLEASEAARSGTTVEERETFLSILDPEIEWIAKEGALDTEGEFHGARGAGSTTRAGRPPGRNGTGRSRRSGRPVT
jgi:hypothetical protein